MMQYVKFSVSYFDFQKGNCVWSFENLLSVMVQYHFIHILMLFFMGYSGCLSHKVLITSYYKIFMWKHQIHAFLPKKLIQDQFKLSMNGQWSTFTVVMLCVISFQGAWVLVSTLCGSCNTWVISIWYVISRYTGCVIMAPDFACILFSGNVCNGSNDTGNPFVMTRMVEQDNSRKYGAGPYIAFLETTNMPSNTVFIWPHRQNQFTWMPQAK